MAIQILVVDDSPHFRATAAELLAMRGFEILEQAADGEQALAVVARACPDGVLLDVNLPGPDGFAVAASLAAVCPMARIVLTSASVDYVPAEALEDSAAIAFCPSTSWPSRTSGRFSPPSSGAFQACRYVSTARTRRC